MLTSTEILVWAIVIHLIADWILQTDWMARNKSSLRNPAAWVHSGIHAALLVLVFPWWLALGVGITHLLIDTRVPVRWWMQTVKRLRSGPETMVVEIWLDQVFHLTVLALAVLLFL